MAAEIEHLFAASGRGDDWRQKITLGGFYTWVTRGLTALPLSAPALLAVLILVVAALAAVFSNDIVCLAVAPVLIEACRGRRLDPIPFLLALACAANIGSAATLIGNPQNMLIGETLKLSFSSYLVRALASTLAGNLLIVGSIANIIVVSSATRRGMHVDWRRYARIGVPVTAATLAICALFVAG